MWLDALIRRWRNPNNLTRIHHAREIARRGYLIGDYTYGRLRIRSWGESAKLVIGPYCSIADGVTIFLGGNHRTDWVTTYPFSDFPDLWPGMREHPSTLSTHGDVTIGPDVWIGAGATILSGVTIGAGAVIAAGAMVVRDVPPYTIAGGNPAKALRMRFDQATVTALIETAWWDLPRDGVARLAPLLQSRDLDGAIALARMLRGGG